ncbi:MAG: hypothetical protein IJ567_09375 [Lachnospiraceae bacterium]|nr:hypothetical protein [Lachnospiraceae bacterium]
MKKNVLKGVLFAGVVVIALSGVLLPGYLVTRKNETTWNQAEQVPEKYYSAAGSAIARNASARLDIHEKLQLVTGKWESFTEPTDSYDMVLADYEAAAMARDSIQKLYAAGLYPGSLSSEYGNWYSWEIQPYRAVDTTFQTYTAYYWRIDFYKYDGTETHTIYMLEDGTVFLARADMQPPHRTISYTGLYEYLSEHPEDHENLTAEKERGAAAWLEGWLDDMELSLELEKERELVKITEQDDAYHVLQERSEHQYLWALVPYQELSDGYAARLD